MSKYKVEVQVVNETSFHSNNLQFDSKEDAKRYAINLMLRWFAVENYRIVEIE